MLSHHPLRPGAAADVERSNRERLERRAATLCARRRRNRAARRIRREIVREHERREADEMIWDPEAGE